MEVRQLQPSFQVQIRQNPAECSDKMAPGRPTSTPDFFLLPECLSFWRDVSVTWLNGQLWLAESKTGQTWTLAIGQRRCWQQGRDVSKGSWLAAQNWVRLRIHGANLMYSVPCAQDADWLKRQRREIICTTEGSVGQIDWFQEDRPAKQ